MTKNTKILGAICVTITSICYGLVPSFSFMSFRIGVETETLLFNKFLYAAIIMWAFLLIRRIPFRFSRRAALTMAVACAGYIGMSTTLYISFDYISGSLATIVSFTFPAMIVAIDRGDKKIVNPTRDTVFMHNDLLWFVSPDEMTLKGFESKLVKI